jgi:hypothetical protein
MATMTRRDAKAAAKRMRTLGEHPHLEDALGAGDISDSWAAEIAGWLKKLPEELRDGTEKILADAAASAASGASLDDRTEKQRFHDALQLAWRWFQFCVMLDV